MLQEVLKKAIRPAKRRELAQHLVEDYKVSTRRACRVVCLARSTYRYQPRSNPSNIALLARIQEIALARVRYG